MTRTYILALLVAITAFNSVQAEYANGWQPDRYSQLRMTKGYAFGTYALMGICFAYHLANSAHATKKRHAALIGARAAREDRALTREEEADLLTTVGSLGKSETWHNIGQSILSGFCGKGGFINVLASVMLGYTIGERVQWAFKTKDGKGGPLTKARRSNAYKVGAWGGLGASILIQAIQAATAKKKNRVVNEDELSSGAQATSKKAGEIGTALLHNLGDGLQGKGGFVNTVTTWVPIAVALERAQWASKERSIK